uniref:Pentatricopeptide repeat-containing protein n=1 Tax=Populus alba TaxID=43335 RepID=A0A4U5PP54_POPAL|nr:hypothetical protein D5086_0000200650 [Populus alba]
MKRRDLIKLLSHLNPYLSSRKSKPLYLSSFHSQSYTLSSQNPKIQRQNSTFITTRFSSTSPSDNLEGLVDPNDPFLQVESRVEAFSSEEFAILRDSLLSPSEDRQRFDLGKCSNEATLIANVILNNNDGFGNQTLKLLREHREKLNPNLVVEVLNIVKIPELCVNFFIWAGRQIGYYHTLPVYNALLEILESSSNNSIDRVPEKFLREIMDDDKQVLGKLLNVLIRKCCQNGLWNAALEELGRLKDFGYKPSRLTYNALVQVFLRAERIDSAYLVHREMTTMGYRMDEFTLGCFAHSLCKSGKWREALSLLEKEEFVPDTVLYTKMISGLCEASLFEEAMDFLTRMRASSCLPNVLTYRILLCGCLNKEKLGRCKRILSMMITEGCYPSPRIFNSLVHAYCRSGDYAYAYKLLKKMVQCGCQPGYVVYNILIGGICSSEEPGKDLLDLAEKAYGEMLEAGVVLNKVQEARDLLKSMSVEGCEPNHVVYDALIDGCCKAGKLDEAQEVFTTMLECGYDPNVYTYSSLIDRLFKDKRVLINHCCSTGHLDEAHKLLEEMKQTYWPRHVAGYRKVIEGFNREFIASLDLSFEISENDSVPVAPVYRVLIDNFIKAGRLEIALELNEELSSFSPFSAANQNIHITLIENLSLAHKADKAFELYAAMISRGGIPELSILVHLIKGLLRVNRWEEALQLLDSICQMDIHWVQEQETARTS